jgi:hypothetical protein
VVKKQINEGMYGRIALPLIQLQVGHYVITMLTRIQRGGG